MTRTALIVPLALAAALSGCAALDTHRVPGGPTGCKTVCEKWGMELAGMVQVGRDSDACVCAVKKEAGASLLRGGATGAVAAVERRREDEAKAAEADDDRPTGPGLLPSIEIPLPTSEGPGQPPLVP
jgi:hypothetical protein